MVWEDEGQSSATAMVREIKGEKEQGKGPEIFNFKPNAIFFVENSQTQNHFKFAIQSHTLVFNRQWAYSVIWGEASAVDWNDQHTGDFLM